MTKSIYDSLPTIKQIVKDADILRGTGSGPGPGEMFAEYCRRVIRTIKKVIKEK